MAEVVAWGATVVVVVLLVAFVVHLVSLHRLPTGERPRVNVYDRQGRMLGRRENPEAASAAETRGEDATGSANDG